MAGKPTAAQQRAAHGLSTNPVAINLLPSTGTDPSGCTPFEGLTSILGAARGGAAPAVRTGAAIFIKVGRGASPLRRLQRGRARAPTPIGQLRREIDSAPPPRGRGNCAAADSCAAPQAAMAAPVTPKTPIGSSMSAKSGESSRVR